MQDAFIGRQPIFDRNIEVYAYELLYRHGFVNYAEIDDDDAASGTVLVNLLLEIGLDNLVGKHKAFCNFTRGFLLQEKDLAFAADRLVVEVLETVEAEEEIVQAVKGYAERGHMIALDDFVYSEALRPLVDLAELIKIDVMELGMEETAQQVKILRTVKPSLKFLAEKVETKEEFQQCLDLGFDYFQGYFFSKPVVVTGKKLPPARLAMLQLMSELQSSDVSMERIEEIIQADVNLSVKLLRQVNSSYYNLINEVTSIKQAIVRVGLQHIRTWASVLIMGSVSDKPDELMTMALVRGKMCELIAVQQRSRQETSYFTVGLFSLLESILDAPMEHILNELPLSDEINRALLFGEGRMGRVLHCVQDYEQGDWVAVETRGIAQDVVVESYWEAISWADDISESMSQV
ncbi:MAG: diguanylate phosphodiesterase [Desulfobacteraceae bacterium 4572_35.1]|nr:MAG: diguanylate phosphodiesterase [Desulfobacteraceae bacterium 4572_35.1]